MDLNTVQENEESAPKKRRLNKTRKETGAVDISTMEKLQSDAAGTTVPTGGVKKRKKRKSIGQQSAKRAKTSRMGKVEALADEPPTEDQETPARQPVDLMSHPDADFAERSKTLAMSPARVEAKKPRKPRKQTVNKTARPRSAKEPREARVEEEDPVVEPVGQTLETTDDVEDVVDTTATMNTEQAEKKPRQQKKKLLGKTAKPRSAKIYQDARAEEIDPVTKPAMETLLTYDDPEGVLDGSSIRNDGRAVKKPRRRKRKPFGKIVKPRSTKFPRKPIAGEETPVAEPPVEVLQIIDQAEGVANTAAVTGYEREGKNPKQPKKRTIGKLAKPEPTRRSRIVATGKGLPTAEPEAEGIQTNDKDQGQVDRADGVEDEEGPVVEPSEHSQKPKPRRKKRKSIGQQKPKRKPTDLSTLERQGSKSPASTHTAEAVKLKKLSAATSTRGEGRMRKPAETAEEEIQNPAPNVTEDENDPPTATEPKKKRGRPKKTDVPPASNPPAVRKAPKSRVQKPKQPSKAASSSIPKLPKAPQNTIPITIYRPASPTSDAAEFENEDDPLADSQHYLPTQTVNAVDVLSQISREIIAKSGASIEQQADNDPANASGLNRQKETVDMYREELEARLFELTKTLDVHSSLTSRLRAAVKEERALKKEIKVLEAEREKIRERKEELMKVGEKRKLDVMLSGIAGAAKRGWEMEAKEKGDEGNEDSNAVGGDVSMEA